MKAEKQMQVVRIIEYQIEEKAQGLSVFDFLKRRRFSRQNLAELKWTPESILINQNPAAMKRIVQVGDRLTVRICEKQNSNQIEPVQLPFPIIYEDEDLMVIDKPAGMPIQPSWYYPDCSLANAAAFYWKQNEKPFVYRCVNRLDKDTSGLTILAKHTVSGAILNEMHRTGELSRTYYAIAKGGDMADTGTIDLPIAKDMDSANKYKVDKCAGLHAVTHYHRLLHTKEWSLLEIRLETGRTHQIRVHMKAIGHPLLGDQTYGIDDPQSLLLKRQALHAGKIEVMHPITGIPLVFRVSMPQDMQQILENF